MQETTDLDPELVPIEELAPARLAVDEGVLPLFASLPLDGPPWSGASEAVIVVHGALRNAGDYYRAVRAAAGEGGNPLIVAPQFLIDVDVRARADREGLLSWGTNDWIGGLWKGGWGPASSYAVMDQLLAAVCRVPGVRGLTRLPVRVSVARGGGKRRWRALDSGLDVCR